MQNHIYTYRIYQLDLDSCPENRSRFGLSYKSLLENKLQIDPTMYKIVYEGEICGEAQAALDRLWLIFNEFRPKDFKSRAMSISDIVVLSRNQKETPFYVDSFGFTKLDRKIKMEEFPWQEKTSPM